MIITIDGPTAGGKSTVAAEVAQRLGLYHLNSGLLYRSLAYVLVFKYHYDEHDLNHIREQDIHICIDSPALLYAYHDGVATITYKGENITPLLKDAKIDYYVSLISSQKIVRDALVAKQREIADQHGLVADGRDVGSYVFPQADYKFFLTATLPVRSERWRHDQEKRGNYFTQEQAEGQVRARDQKDEQRIISPLIVPSGAVVIDSTQLTMQQVVDYVIACVKGKDAV